MNPAVAFKLVADAAHSVVLTSGTLAPLEGFASEVGLLSWGRGWGRSVNLSRMHCTGQAVLCGHAQCDVISSP